MNLVAEDPFKIDSKTVVDFARVGVFHMPRRRDFRFTPTRLLKGEAIVCYCEPLIIKAL